MITRFQPRSHGGSSYKLIFGREYSGEIAEMGEQLWYRLAARVLAGRGKWEAIFARGIWVGKSEIDDTHLVVDLERGIQKVRTVRRMPVELRWNAEMRGVCARFGALCLPRCRVSVCLSGLPRLECLLPVLLARVPTGPLSSHSSVQHDVHPRLFLWLCVRRGRGVLVCLRMFTQHAARLSRSDILPWATPFWFFLFVLLRFSE